MRALGVLLAGGRGTRMTGDEPKALALCAGRTLLERSHATLAALCDEVVVVAPASMALPVADSMRVADLGVAGPLAALIQGLGSRACDEALVLAVDLPLVLPAMLASLRSLRGTALAVVPRPGGVPQPLAAWYDSHALAALASSLASGERSVIRAVATLSPVWVDDDELASLPGGLAAWLNVNTRDDLVLAAQRLASRAPA